MIKVEAKSINKHNEVAWSIYTCESVQQTGGTLYCYYTSSDERGIVTIKDLEYLAVDGRVIYNKKESNTIEDLFEEKKKKKKIDYNEGVYL